MKLAFSGRTAWDATEGSLAAAVRKAKEAGRPLLDLTVSNPTLCGFHFDPSLILDPLGSRGGMRYDPDPQGLRSAREAVAAYYAGHGARADPSQIFLTTSTSEAYSFLFRLLCDAGDAVLAPQPSYPLFNFLADLDDVVLQPYPLFFDFGWWIDFAELERRITPRTRAVLLVHPNNPTGHITSQDERVRLEEVCVKHGLALIVDEVFLDYSLGASITSFTSGSHPCLTFVVSGLSKIAALPQMKVAWLVCLGPEDLRREALSRLEVVADTFLSMSAPVQHALPAWLESREVVATQILSHVRQNLFAAERIFPGIIDVLPVEAGWSAILGVPRSMAGADLTVSLVEEAGVVVHAASFYDLPAPQRFIVSLITPHEEFVAGMVKLKAWCQASLVRREALDPGERPLGYMP